MSILAVQCEKREVKSGFRPSNVRPLRTGREMFQEKILIENAVPTRSRKPRGSVMSLHNEEIMATILETKHLGSPFWKADTSLRMPDHEIRENICIALMHMFQGKNLPEIAQDCKSPEIFTIAHYIRNLYLKEVLRVNDENIFRMIMTIPAAPNGREPCISRFWFSQALISHGFISGRCCNANIKPAASTPTTKDILEVIEEFTGVSADRIRSCDRDRVVSDARFKAIYTIRQVSTLSLSQIGRHMGNRDHTTILNGIVQVRRKIENDAGRMNVIMRICNVADTIGAMRGYRFISNQKS